MNNQFLRVLYMRYFFIFILFLFGNFSVFPSLAKPLIVTSIKPIGLIAQDIAGDLAFVDVLLSENASPHDYALKPSDIQLLQSASLVFWVGPEVESFLTKVLKKNPQAVQLTAYPGMPLRQYASKGGHDHEEEEKGHSHDTGVDGHIWLGTLQSKVIAKAMASKLIEIDPENKASYEKNLAFFIKEVDEVQKEIQETLDRLKVLPSTPSLLTASSKKHPPSKQKGYFLFHDGYGYFEAVFNLKPSGHITLTPERKAGARTLVAIRTALKNKEAVCVFSESQFNPATVESVTKGTQTKVVLLDPMGQNLTLKKHRYVDFLKAIGKSYQVCFDATAV